MEDHIPIRLDRSLLLGYYVDRLQNGLYGMWSSMKMTLKGNYIIKSFSLFSSHQTIQHLVFLIMLTRA